MWALKAVLDKLCYSAVVVHLIVSMLNLTHVQLSELNTVYAENIVTATVYSTADSAIRVSMINHST